MTAYDATCPYCIERAALSVRYRADVGPCPIHAVHWASDSPTSLHGNGAVAFANTTRDPAEVTCKLCLTLLIRAESERDLAHNTWSWGCKVPTDQRENGDALDATAVCPVCERSEVSR